MLRPVRCVKHCPLCSLRLCLKFLSAGSIVIVCRNCHSLLRGMYCVLERLGELLLKSDGKLSAMVWFVFSM